MNKAESLDNFVKSIDKYGIVSIDNINNPKRFVVHLSDVISMEQRNLIFKSVQLDSDQILEIKVNAHFMPNNENQKIMDRARAVWFDAQSNLKLAKSNLSDAQEIHSNCESACEESLHIVKKLIKQFGDTVN